MRPRNFADRGAITAHMNAISRIHFERARNRFQSGLLPDKAMGGFVNAALDGTGRLHPWKEAARGLAKDAREFLPDTFAGATEVARGVVAAFQPAPG